MGAWEDRMKAKKARQGTVVSRLSGQGNPGSAYNLQRGDSQVRAQPVGEPQIFTGGPYQGGWERRMAAKRAGTPFAGPGGKRAARAAQQPANIPPLDSTEDFDFDAQYDSSMQNLQREILRRRAADQTTDMNEQAQFSRGQRGLERGHEQNLTRADERFADNGILNSGINIGERGRLGAEYQGQMNDLTTRYQQGRTERSNAFTDFSQQIQAQINELRLDRTRRQSEREGERARREAEVVENERAATEARNRVREEIQRAQPKLGMNGDYTPGYEGLNRVASYTNGQWIDNHNGRVAKYGPNGEPAWSYDGNLRPGEKVATMPNGQVIAYRPGSFNYADPTRGASEDWSKLRRRT